MIKYYLIGEMHGTNESYKAGLAIIKKYKIKRVALEFLDCYQNELDEFMSGKRELKEMSIFKYKTDFNDGRASAATERLISKLRTLRIETHFICSSELNKIHCTQDAWNRAMADNLLKIKPPVAFYCGNVHAAKSPFFEDIKPVGYFLPKGEALTFNIVSFNAGEHYNFGIRKYSGMKGYTNVSINKFPIIIKSPDKAFDFYYVVKRFTPSK